VSYFESNARTVLDSRDDEHDEAHRIGCSRRPNSTGPVSARTYCRQDGLRRGSYCHLAIRSSQWRSVTVRELSMTRDGCIAEKSYHLVRAQRDFVVASARHGNGVSFLFLYCYFGIKGIRSPCLAQYFCCLSSLLVSNGHSRRLGEMQQGSRRAGDSEASLSAGR